MTTNNTSNNTNTTNKPTANKAVQERIALVKSVVSCLHDSAASQASGYARALFVITRATGNDAEQVGILVNPKPDKTDAAKLARKSAREHILLNVFRVAQRVIKANGKTSLIGAPEFGTEKVAADALTTVQSVLNNAAFRAVVNRCIAVGLNKGNSLGGCVKFDKPSGIVQVLGMVAAAEKDEPITKDAAEAWFSIGRKDDAMMTTFASMARKAATFIKEAEPGSRQASAGKTSSPVTTLKGALENVGNLLANVDDALGGKTAEAAAIALYHILHTMGVASIDKEGNVILAPANVLHAKVSATMKIMVAADAKASLERDAKTSVA